MKPAELLEFFSARRSVKPAQFNGETIEDETIALMLEAARWAPTHALTQPWRFTVIEGSGIARFTEFMQEAYKAHTPEDKFNVLKYEKLGNSLRACSHIILVGMKRQDIQKLPEWEEIAAVSAAVQNMQLVGYALGAVGYWSTGGVSTHEVMLPWLKLSENDKALGILLMGKSDVEPPVPERRPIDYYTNFIDK
jgi:nitroreductase